MISVAEIGSTDCVCVIFCGSGIMETAPAVTEKEADMASAAMVETARDFSIINVCVWFYIN